MSLVSQCQLVRVDSCDDVSWYTLTNAREQCLCVCVCVCVHSPTHTQAHTENIDTELPLENVLGHTHQPLASHLVVDAGISM